MARIAPGLSAREWLLAGAFGLYLTAAPLGAVALIAAPTAVDAVRVPFYAAIGMLVGFFCGRRSQRRTPGRGRPSRRWHVAVHGIALPCALSFVKFYDLGWDDPRLGGVLFLGGGLSVLWRVLVHRRVARRRAHAAATVNAVPARSPVKAR